MSALSSTDNIKEGEFSIFLFACSFTYFETETETNYKHVTATQNPYNSSYDDRVKLKTFLKEYQKEKTLLKSYNFFFLVVMSSHAHYCIVSNHTFLDQWLCVLWGRGRGVYKWYKWLLICESMTHSQLCHINVICSLKRRYH